MWVKDRIDNRKVNRPILRGSMAKKRFDELEVGGHYKGWNRVTKTDYYFKVGEKRPQMISVGGFYKDGPLDDEKPHPYDALFPDDKGGFDDDVPLKYKRKLDRYEKELILKDGDVLQSNWGEKRHHYYRIVKRTKKTATVERLKPKVIGVDKDGYLGLVPSSEAMSQPKR